MLSKTLAKAGYRAVECSDGKEALERLASETPDLVLLDVEMPGLNGWKTLEELRARGVTQPVLMFTQVNDVDSRVRGLEGGADDYLGKPCTAAELLAKVKAWLRRAPPRSAVGRELLRFQDVTIDVERRSATKGGEPLRLTKTDYALITLLHEHVGEPVSRDVILRRVWNDTTGNFHVLDTHLWRLRKKIGDTADEPQLIRNVAGFGYLMVATAT
jgi:DNA-binding response OmpR family regulator